MTVRARMSLHAGHGSRKYLNGAERSRFLTAAAQVGPVGPRLFCLTLFHTGARVSEVLALTAGSFDLDRGVAAIVTLKRRRPGMVREVNLPSELMAALAIAFDLEGAQSSPSRAGARLWPFCRQTAWRSVKAVMLAAGVRGTCAMPKGLRHGFAVAAFQALVPSHLVQRWMGHASLSTTAVYGDVMGEDERAFAERLWRTGS